MDALHAVLGWFDHNRGLVVAVVLGVLASVWIVSCAPTTTSIIDPEKQVTGEQLTREFIIVQQGFSEQAAVITQLQAEYNARVEAANAQLEAAGAHLQRQVDQRVQLLELLGGIATAVSQGGFSGPTAVASVIQVITALSVGGLLYDTRRKSREIGDRDNRLAESEAPAKAA